MCKGQRPWNSPACSMHFLQWLDIYSGGETGCYKTWNFKLNLTLKVMVNCPQDNRDLNQGVLHLWSKYGEPSLKVGEDKGVPTPYPRVATLYPPPPPFFSSLPPPHFFSFFPVHPPKIHNFCHLPPPPPPPPPRQSDPCPRPFLVKSPLTPLPQPRGPPPLPPPLERSMGYGGDKLKWIYIGT